MMSGGERYRVGRGESQNSRAKEEVSEASGEEKLVS